MPSVAEAFARVLEVLDQLEISYLVGGSVASSIHGISRPTMDVDIVADLRSDQVPELSSLLQPDFYADTSMMREALARGRPFNLIHYASSFKIDIFPLGADLYSRASFARRRLEQSRAFGPSPIECAVATPEDTILRKLEWYRAGGEISERQWSDMQGVLQVNRGRLEMDYLNQWARHLKVDDLLKRLLGE